MERVYMLESFYKKRMENGSLNSCVAMFMRKQDAEAMKSEIEQERDDIQYCHITEHALINLVLM